MASAKPSTDSKESEASGDKEKEKEKKEKEPDFEMLQNPTRVIKPQVLIRRLIRIKTDPISNHVFFF